MVCSEKDLQSFNKYQDHHLVVFSHELRLKQAIETGKEEQFHKDLLLEQGEILKRGGELLPEEMIVASAKYLAAQNEGAGYSSPGLEVKGNWRGSAGKLIVIFNSEAQFLGKGGSGSVSSRQGMVVQPEKRKVNPKQIATKQFTDVIKYVKAKEGNRLAAARFEAYAQKGKKLVGIAKPYTNFDDTKLKADMKGYMGDLTVWVNTPILFLQLFQPLFLPFRQLLICKTIILFMWIIN